MDVSLHCHSFLWVKVLAVCCVLVFLLWFFSFLFSFWFKLCVRRCTDTLNARKLFKKTWVMVIYLSCKYYETIYNALLDVKASQDSSPQCGVQRDWWESSLCLTSVLIIKSRGHFSGQKWCILPQLQSHLFEVKKQKNSTRLRDDVP